MLIMLTSLSEVYSKETSNPSESTAFPRKSLKTIIVADYYPYSFVNDTGAPDGFSVDLIKAVAQVMGLKVEIGVDTWENAKKALEKGSIDFLPMMASSYERSQSFDFSVPHTIAYDAVFVRKGSPEVKSFEDLSEKSVIVLNKDIAHDYLLSSGISEKMKLVFVDSLPDGLRLLASGEADALIMPKLVGLVLLKNLNITNVEASSNIIESYNRPFCFAVKKGNTALLERLSQGLIIVNTTGQYKDIYKKWFGVMESPGLPWKSVLKYLLGIASVFLLIGMALLLWSVSLRKQVALRTESLEAEIVERKKIEKALSESEQRYRRIVETAYEGIWTIDRDLRTTFVNRHMAEMLGYAAEEMLGRPLASFLFEDDLPNFQDRMRKRAQGAKEIFERRFRQKDGTEIWTLVSATPIFDEAGAFQGAFGMHSDVTKLKRIQENLRESEEKFSKVFRYAPVIMTLTTMNDGMCLDVNDKFCDLSGFTREEVIGKRAVELGWFSQEDRDQLIERLSVDGHVSGVEMKQLSKDKGQFIFIYYGQLISISGRSVLLSIVYDVTELRKAQELLQRNEEKYLNLFQDAPLMYVITRNEQDVPFIVDCNKLFLHSVGFSREEVIGKPLADFYSPKSRAQLLEGGGYARSLAGEFIMGERQLVTRDGGLIQTFLYTKPETDYSGHVTGTRAMFVDITAVRKAEEAQIRLATAIEQSIESVMITDRNGKIQYINPAFEDISGYRKEEVIGRSTRFLKSDRHNSSYYKGPLAAIRNGNPWKGRLVSQRKDGRIFYEDVAISPVRDFSGEIVNFVDVGHDVTENVELQMQLLQAQKMEAIGTLAGGIAHDFNNLLQAVLGYSEFMLQRKKEGEPDYVDLQRIYQAGKRGADLVKSLLTFSRKVETKYVPVNLNQEITQVQDLLSRTIPKTIKIDLHLSGDLESIQADSSQIGQVLMNLGVNAKDAMPDGGTLTIETANIRLDEEYCSAHLEAKPGDYVLLAVSDTGQGMDKETLSHIFEPFYTTKERGKGTGLGLATVYGIVKKHDGHIICYSEPEHGTTFTIYFPSIQMEKDSDTPTDETPIPGGTETVLLVDNEEDLRALGTTLLKRFGYKVIMAGNGKEALEIYRMKKDRISLVLLDLMMPEMDGRQCLTEILRIDPNAKVLIASGYSESGQANVAMAGGAKGFVQKPYNMRQLLNTVREILDKN